MDIGSILHQAEYKAEEYVKNTTVPSHLDQIDFLKCEAIELKALDLKWFLMHELKKKQEALVQQRNQLFQQLQPRNK